MSTSTSFYGEHQCQISKKDGDWCTNKAYYFHSQLGKLSCGVHCKKEFRQELSKNPNAKEIRTDELKLHMESVHRSVKVGTIGTITLEKMLMMKNPKLKDGILNVFPNFKHNNRTDGLGLPNLSPKSIGPIDHGQKDLPIALNLENFHQGSKVFSDEVDSNGKVSSSFYETQKLMFEDSVPHRHKSNAKGKNVPLFFVWKVGEVEHYLTYIESRQFYCNFYERKVSVMPDFAYLVKLVKAGYNICLCGYDAYMPDRSLEEHYLDPSRPFGHELVLYTMLMFEINCLDKSDFPWRLHKTFEF